MGAFPTPLLSRAEHRRLERIRLADLSERSEFPRDPFDPAARREKRDTGVFFWFVFFHVEENEQLVMNASKWHP